MTQLNKDHALIVKGLAKETGESEEKILYALVELSVMTLLCLAKDDDENSAFKKLIELLKGSEVTELAKIIEKNWEAGKNPNP